MRYYRLNGGVTHASATCPRLARSHLRRGHEIYHAGAGISGCRSCGQAVTHLAEVDQVREAAALLRTALQDLLAATFWGTAGTLVRETARLRKHLAHLTDPLPVGLHRHVHELIEDTGRHLADARAQLGTHPALTTNTAPVVLLDDRYEPWAVGHTQVVHELMAAAEVLVVDEHRHCALMILPAGFAEDHHIYTTVPAQPGDDPAVLATAIQLADLDDVTYSGWSAYRQRRLLDSLELARLIHLPAAS